MAGEGGYTKTMKHIIVFSLLFASGMKAQNISYGVRGGIPLNDAFNVAVKTLDPVSRAQIDAKVVTNHLVIGPTMEVRLPLGLGLQVDALYTRHKLTTSSGTNSASSWEIPLLAKYRFPGLVLRPFVEGGVSFQRFGDIANLVTTLSSDRSRRGFVMGAGMEAHLAKVRLAPEIRWTRWGDAKFITTPAALFNSSSQFEFLVGLTF